MIELSELRASGRVVISAAPETVYDMISDITRMGEWSPACKGGSWDEGAGPCVGSWFTAQNVLGEREYENRCEVIVAERAKEFAWIVGGAEQGASRWGYRFTPTEGGTEVEESSAVVRFTERLRELPDERLLAIVERNRAGIAATLDNLKNAAQSG
jgi:uncharacterized protein YndB with AHSA1/START domain